MELIPILSTIILVATIITFILAIGAYILYKVRERKEQEEYVPRTRERDVEAELIVPEDEYEEEYDYDEDDDIRRKVIYEKRDVEYEPESGKRNYRVVEEEEIRETPDEKYVRLKRKKRKTNGSKYLQYTSEGYVPPKKEKKNGAPRWR